MEDKVYSVTCHVFASFEKGKSSWSTLKETFPILDPSEPIVDSTLACKMAVGYYLSWFAKTGQPALCCMCFRIVSLQSTVITTSLCDKERSVEVWLGTCCDTRSCKSSASTVLYKPYHERRLEFEKDNPKGRIFRKCRTCWKIEEPGDSKMKSCSKCNLVRYCSVACQMKDWSEHKEFCKQTSD